MLILSDTAHIKFKISVVIHKTTDPSVLMSNTSIDKLLSKHYLKPFHYMIIFLIVLLSANKYNSNKRNKYFHFSYCN